MPHYNGHGNGHQSNGGRNSGNHHDGDHSLPEKASIGKNGSIPEGYDSSDSGPNVFSMALLAALFWCGIIALIVLFFQ